MNTREEQPSLFHAIVEHQVDRAERMISYFVERRGGERRRAASDKLACPNCGHFQSSVLPHMMTPAEQLTEGYWRRRVCLQCRHVFATEERITSEPSLTSSR